MKNKLSIKKDEWIKKIISDPKEVPSLSLITGFIGDSSEEGHVRVYFNLDLSQFLDIKEEDIVHSVELSSNESPFGGSKLWIKKSTEVVLGNPSKERTKAKFFEGNIYNAYNDSVRGATDAHCSKYPYCLTPNDYNSNLTKTCSTADCQPSDRCTDTCITANNCPPSPDVTMSCGTFDYRCSTPNPTKYNCSHEDTAYYNRITDERAIWTELICTDSCSRHCTDASSSCKTYVQCSSKYCTKPSTCPTERPHCPFDDPHITNICKTNAVDCPSDHHNCYNRYNNATYYCDTDNNATYYCNIQQRGFYTEVTCITDPSSTCQTYVECGSKYCTDEHTCASKRPHCPPLDPHITNICDTNAIKCPKHRY